MSNDSNDSNNSQRQLGPSADQIDSVCAIIHGLFDSFDCGDVKFVLLTATEGTSADGGDCTRLEIGSNIKLRHDIGSVMAHALQHSIESWQLWGIDVEIDYGELKIGCESEVEEDERSKHSQPKYPPGVESTVTEIIEKMKGGNGGSDGKLH
jgi:hypothetical protein